MKTPLALVVVSSAMLALAGAGEGKVPPTLVLPPPSAAATPGVAYKDATRSAGFESFRQVSGSAAKDYILEVTGSGVALLDYDGDGWLDAYLVNGSTFQALRGEAEAPPAALFHNNRDGTFTDVTAAAGVANRRWGQGVCAGDFDNDGRTDFYVTNFGANRLYRNGGQGAFIDVAEAAGVTLGGWSTGCAFGDYDGDGLLDLFVAGYVALDLGRLPPSPSHPAPRRPAEETKGATEGPRGMGAAYSAGMPFCEYRGQPAMCGPRGLKGAPDHLFHNNGDGTFTDVSERAGVADARGFYGFGVAFFDFDDDGRLDLFVANDSTPNYLYRNRGDGTFEDVSYPSGAALTEAGLEQAHMGVAVGDYDRDGRDDLHVTNFADDTNILYHNDGKGLFSEATFPAGIGHPSLPFLGWGTHFLDYDNDGWLDLFVANGHVYPFVDRFEWNTSYRQRPLLLKNRAGRFVEVTGSAGDGPRRGAEHARVGRGRPRQRRRRRRSRERHRRRAALPAQRGWGEGRPLAHRAPRGGSGETLPARRHRLGGLCHDGRRAPAGRGGERPEPGLPVGPARAFRPGRGHSRGPPRGALGQRAYGRLRDPRRGHRGRHRPGARAGDPHREGCPRKAMRGGTALGWIVAVPIALGAASTGPSAPDPPAPTPVRFVDVTEALRIDFRHEASPTSQKYLPETMGGGVAVFDFDNDGRLDLFFVNGARIDDPMPKGALPVKDGPRYANRLYHQTRDGRFEDVTARAGLTGSGYGQGVAVGDFDNDGDEDLYVTALFGNRLYRNDGDGRFTDVTAEAGVAGSGWSTSATFVDVDHDGRLDLFVARYLDWSFEVNPYCGEPKPGPRAYCHPDQWKGASGSALPQRRRRPLHARWGSGPGVANPEGKSLGVAIADFDGDGKVDLFVANDSVRQFLYRNRGDGTFQDQALLAGVAYDQDGQTFAGMGVDFADYDNDGRPDVVVTNLSNQRYALYRNAGDGTFSYETHASGLGALTLLHSGWGVRFLDYDNDGTQDLFLAQGHVMDTIEQTSPHLRYRQPPLLAKNEGGRFTDASGSAGDVFRERWAARGMAVGDLDDDGDQDVVVTTVGGRPYVLRNDGGNRGHWISLRLVGHRSNRDGIGALVRLTTASGALRQATVTTSSQLPVRERPARPLRPRLRDPGARDRDSLAERYGATSAGRVGRPGVDSRRACELRSDQG